MNLYLVVVWKQPEDAMKPRVAVGQDGRALREVFATSAAKAERQVIAQLGDAYDSENMEVEVTDPFADE